MAFVGLKYCVFAPITTETPFTPIVYDTGVVLGRMIGANITFNRNSEPLYADDGLAESDNSITGGNPLHIRIRTEGESFLIENNYTPRSDGDKESLGMGLERIRSVYRFYTEENISISVGDGTFRCRLPLLPPEK